MATDRVGDLGIWKMQSWIHADPVLLEEMGPPRVNLYLKVFKFDNVLWFQIYSQDCKTYPVEEGDLVNFLTFGSNTTVGYVQHPNGNELLKELEIKIRKEFEVAKYLC